MATNEALVIGVSVTLNDGGDQAAVALDVDGTQLGATEPIDLPPFEMVRFMTSFESEWAFARVQVATFTVFVGSQPVATIATHVGTIAKQMTVGLPLAGADGTAIGELRVTGAIQETFTAAFELGEEAFRPTGVQPGGPGSAQVPRGVQAGGPQSGVRVGGPAGGASVAVGVVPRGVQVGGPGGATRTGVQVGGPQAPTSTATSTPTPTSTATSNPSPLPSIPIAAPPVYFNPTRPAIARRDFPTATAEAERETYIDYVNPYSLLDYIQSDLSINMMVAVDYTISNGNPNSESSLHTLVGASNPYIDAMRSVGSIMSDYSTTGDIPAFGFGGKVGPNAAEASQCFSMSGFPQNPVCAGLEAVIACYRDSLAHVELSAPTTFDQVVRTATAFAEADPHQYNVLILLTDGCITGGNTPYLTDTIDSLVAAANSSLSVVIVGVGDEDWSQMTLLDADDSPLMNSRGEVAARDICNFIAMNDYAFDMNALAAAVLEEIPGQILSYMASRRIHPGDLPARQNQKPHLPPMYSDSANLPPGYQFTATSAGGEHSSAATATPAGGAYQEQLAQLTAMGFDEGACLVALQAHNGDVSAAINDLM